jgi:hypothetical protein
MTDSEQLARSIRELLDHYFALGCPCRFPRFRAVTARDDGPVGSMEQSMLIVNHEQKSQVTDKQTIGPAWRGTCARCGGSLHQWSNEVAPSSWVDHLEVEPGLEDIGAKVDGPTPRCMPMFAAGPGISASEVKRAEAKYPLLDMDAWLDWMRST